MTLNRRAAIAAGAAVVTAAAVAGRSRPGFLWGVATAAHQIEGNNSNSDFWVLERIKDTYFREPSGDACDSFNRWREDLALVVAAGLNAYRFGVEWARIEPEDGAFSVAMLEYYRRICVACREAGVEPVVTFHHFTSPRWVAAMGGWENPETADRFARYAGVVAKALGPTIGWACTMNEPNAQVTSKVMALGKPWDKAPLILANAARAVGSDRFGAYFLGDAFKVRDVCLIAHAKARDAIKSAAPHIKVGLTLALQELAAAEGGEALYRQVYDSARASFYDAARGDDFIGVQTYNSLLTGPAGYVPTANPTMIDMSNTDASPQALAATVREAHAATGIPIFVTENGINTADDAQRIRHLRATVASLAKVVDAGVPVLGYLHWSLLDNFEWTQGYVPRFGMVAVDRLTFKRRPKPSLAAYRQLVREMRTAKRWA